MDKGLNNPDFFSESCNILNTKALDLRTYSPLSFAFVGDAVFTMIIRTMVVAKGNTKANMLHNITSHYVKAQSQALMAESIADILTEEEADIYRRGKNTHVNGHTRSASTYDYKCATGLEALFGYLYLGGHTERLFELAEACVAAVDNK